MQLKELLCLFSLLAAPLFVHFVFNHHRGLVLVGHFEIDDSLEWNVGDRTKWPSSHEQYLKLSANGTWHSLNKTDRRWLAEGVSQDFRLDRKKAIKCIGGKWIFLSTSFLVEELGERFW